MQDAQDIVDSVEALLGGDKSKDVRMAVVLSLPLDTDTLPVLLRRARDVSPQVSITHTAGLPVALCRCWVCQQSQRQRGSRMSSVYHLQTGGLCTC